MHRHKKILITRFPLQSAWGGEEEIHLVMAQIFQKHAISTELLSSCTHLGNRFQEEGFCVRCEFQKDITSKWKICFSIFSVPFFFLRGLFWIPYFRYVRKVQTVLFLTFIEKIAWTPIAKLFGMKVFWGHHAPFGKWFSRNPYLFLWKLWVKYVQIIVPSGFMKQELLAFTPQKDRILVLPNTLAPAKDLSSVQESSAQEFSHFLKRKIGINLSKERLFFVGTASRLSREKGMFDVLYAAEKLQQTNIVFLFAGIGKEEHNLQREVQEKKLKNVSFLGFLNPEELKVFLKNIHLFLLPSHAEPFGIALLEAMSAQKAIVASAVGGIPEVLGDQNEGLFEVKNQSDLIVKITSFWEDADLRKKWEQHNSNQFQRYFSRSIFEKNSLDIFFPKIHGHCSPQRDSP